MQLRKMKYKSDIKKNVMKNKENYEFSVGEKL